MNPDDSSRCEERKHMTDHEISGGPIQRTDVALKEYIDRAFWKDDVLRAIEYSEIDVHVRDGVVHLNGHITSSTSQRRIKNAIRAMPGILEIKDHLILDDKLTLEVAAALGALEHTYACKFFTGASHGVISLNGNVSDENVKMLAEQSAASHPNVRGVINHVHVSGVMQGVEGQPFLQPAIGEIIYFLDGVSGIVKQVIMNPSNRRVIAMTLQGSFTDRRYELNSQIDGEARSPEKRVMLPMSVVRYLTKASGFLSIRSNERTRYVDFDPGDFVVPHKDWIPPYPYCSDEVLFPLEYQGMSVQIPDQPHPVPAEAILEGVSFREQLLANDSLGG